MSLNYKLFSGLIVNKLLLFYCWLRTQHSVCIRKLIIWYYVFGTLRFIFQLLESRPPISKIKASNYITYSLITWLEMLHIYWNNKTNNVKIEPVNSFRISKTGLFTSCLYHCPTTFRHTADKCFELLQDDRSPSFLISNLEVYLQMMVLNVVF